MWGNDDFEDDPLKEVPLDNSCYLAVGVASNIVAKGNIMMDTCEEEFIKVMLEISVQGEASLPIPLEDEFIVKVKDAVGHILSWPRHLVIRCSDLEKAMAKPMNKPVKESESKKDKKRPREPDEEKEKENELEEDTRKKIETKKENNRQKEHVVEKKEKEDEGKRKMTRAQRKTRIRMERNAVLIMTAHVVDGHLLNGATIKVQCEEDLFGYGSFTYLNWGDFEAIFTLSELTGSVITSYMMFLYEQIKNGPIHDSGICFVSPSATSPSSLKPKPKHIEDASRAIVNQLVKRKDYNIVLVPYNPGEHWVLAVLCMKTSTCYYLDSLRPRNVNERLKQIIDAAMAVYAVESEINTRVKLNWVNASCPRQPGFTECGYYVMKFMKEIVYEGIDKLVNNNVGGGIDHYTDKDIDEIREEWSTYAAAFTFIS